ncbi:MAG: prepilin-type N-terminal cleavage/methylation domain-containing protein [Candidatus Omnitrophica bacterium]|nr:prepilin-type N-terminal cleavage/methylation domain-containing protein [Candidatus Omnitrophota bacterium]
MKSRRGFTLIEILMAASLAAVVGMAIYSSLASGINMMRKVVETSRDEDAAIFLEKFERDLENSFHYQEIPFQGESESLSFAGIIQTDPGLGGEQGIGRITYYHDSSEKTIVRRQDNVHQLFEDREGNLASALDNISSLQFEYFGYEQTESQYKWNREWDPVARKGTVPIAVRAEFQVHGEGGPRIVSKRILIPVAD